MDEQSAINRLEQAVKGIKALDGISNDDRVLGAIDMYSAAICTLVTNAVLHRANNPPSLSEPEPIEGEDVAANEEPEAPES